MKAKLHQRDSGRADGPVHAAPGQQPVFGVVGQAGDRGVLVGVDVGADHRPAHRAIFEQPQVALGFVEGVDFEGGDGQVEVEAGQRLGVGAEVQ